MNSPDERASYSMRVDCVFKAETLRFQRHIILTPFIVRAGQSKLAGQAELGLGLFDLLSNRSDLPCKMNVKYVSVVLLAGMRGFKFLLLQ